MKKLLEIFLIYLKIGAFTIGGGYAMLPLIQVEVVDKKKWMSTDEFMDMFAVIQSAPGPIAVNSAVFLGYKIGKVKGSIAATLGAVIPSFTIILIIAIFFKDFRSFSFVEGVFKGVRPAVVALIAAAVYKLSKSTDLTKGTIAQFLIILIAIVLLGIHPILLIIASALTGIVVASKKQERGRE
jgi:chromate transporter